MLIMDLLVSPTNSPGFLSRFQEPKAEGKDALLQPWLRRLLYAFSPTLLIRGVGGNALSVES